MPTDPPSANQSNPPGPLGQAQPPAQQLPQRQTPYQFAQQQQIPLHPSQQASPLQHAQYGISGQPPLHSLPQQSHQRPASQPQQPQQQPRPPMNQQQSFFPVNNYPQHINSFPGQQFPMRGYIYQGHPYAYPMPGTNPPQQQTSVASRAQRQFPQPMASSVAQRTPGRTIPVPPPQRKKILQIVDPDTNEEVKVSKVETRPPPKPVQPVTTPHPPVKIPPRRSHALELISDPADEPKDTTGAVKPAAPSAKTVPHEASKDFAVNGDEGVKKAIPAVKRQTTVTDQPAVSHDEGIAAPTSIETKETLEAEAEQTKDSKEGVQRQQPVPHVEEIPKSKISSPTSDPLSTPAQATREDHVPQETATTKQLRPQVSKADDSHIKPGPDGALDEESVETIPTKDEVSLGESQQTVSGSAVEHEKAPPPAPSTAPRDKAVPRADKPSDSRLTIKSPSPSSVSQERKTTANVTSAEPSASSKSGAEAKQDLGAQGPASEISTLQSEKPSAQQPADTSTSLSNVEKADSGPVEADSQPSVDRPMFAEGERRVYVPSFMWEMKSVPNSKKAPEYESALGSRDILKNGSPANLRRSDSRGSRPVRTGSGPLSTDPRRAFPGQGGPGFQMVSMRGAAPPGMGPVGMGSYDAFDLRSARSQAPPPAPKGQSSVRDGDPRGSRQHGSRGRYDGPTRHGQTPVDPFVMHPPVEKLKRTEKGWKRNREADDEVTTKVKTVRSLLNKLTLEKFEKIYKQIVEVGITSIDVLDGVVTEIFEKTLFEPKFSAMYAELCRRLEVSLKEVLAKANILDTEGKPITFRKILLNHCRDEFTRFAQSSEGYEDGDKKDTDKAEEESPQEEPKEDEGLSPAEALAKAKLRKSEEEMKAAKAKRRMLANVRFIGELFLKDLLREQIIHKHCIQKLLSLGIEKKEEDTLEALCKLISKTGAKLSENKDAINHIDSYFRHLQALSMDHTLPARIRFMLQDLIEQRANNWKVRREEAGAKTIAEIHREIEKEERAKQEAQAAARERRSRGAGMHGRDRSQQSYTPRVPMTMASASSRRSGPNVSRTNSVIEKIEKFGTRGTATMPSNNLQSLRLGPGGTRPIGVGGSGSGPLRPGSGSGMFGSFAALTESRDTGMNGQSGDVRRGKVSRPPATGRRAPPRPQPMSADKLKQKTRSVVKEFWSVGLLDEVRQTLTEEIHPPNYSAFVEEAIRVSIDAKVDESEKSVGLLRDLTNEPLFGVDLVNGFSAFLSQLADLEVDNPRVTEFLGKYIGAVASTRKLPEGGNVGFGLDFVVRSIPETEDPKRTAKLFISIFATLRKEMSTSMPNERERTGVLKRAYASLGLDIAGLMNTWNPMRGLSSLEDMLKSSGVSFLAPYVKFEQSLKALLQGAPAGDKVLELLTTITTPDEGLLRAVVRESLDWVFMSPVEDVKESFSAIVGMPLKKAFGSGFSQSAQMGALLEAQFFVTKNLEVLPPRKVGSLDRPGAIAFDLLYDTEIVSRDSLVQWKEDTGRSRRVPGKDKMLIQTSQFFQWLTELQQ